MSHLPPDLEARLGSAAPAGVAFTTTTDPHGVTAAWCELASKDELKPVGEMLRSLGARLSMIAGSQPPPPPEEEEEEETDDAEPDDTTEAAPKASPTTFGGTPMDGTAYELTYHFDLGGDTLTVVVFVPAGGSIASLTPLFRTADWPEREIMETYTLIVRDHPDPRRLFIDETVEPAVLEHLIPFSTLVNAGSTKDLWQKVMGASKAGSA